MTNSQELVLKIFNEVLNKRQFQLCNTLFDENCTSFLRGKISFSNSADYKDYLKKWFEANPDLKYEVKDIITQSNKVAVRWKESDPSKNFFSNAQAFFLISGDKVKEMWEVCEEAR